MMRGFRWGRNYTRQPCRVEKYADGTWAAFATLGRFYLCAFGSEQ